MSEDETQANDEHWQSYLCRHVAHEDALIAYVVHDHEGDWQFLCGEKNHYGSEDIVIMCGDCLFKSDPTLKGIEMLDKGFTAERAADDLHSWTVEPYIERVDSDDVIIEDIAQDQSFFARLLRKIQNLMQ